MMSFEKEVIYKTVKKLLHGEDYRDEVVNAINVQFLDFSINFFKDIVFAKLDQTSIDLDWYKKQFIENPEIDIADVAVYSGMNKKTINNIYGSTKKEIVLEIAEKNFTYLSDLIENLGEDKNHIDVQIRITYKDVSVDLSLSESLLVMNALATKKIALRGGAWSSIGKKVEKPLMLALCEAAGVSKNNINASVFRKDSSLDFDREVDFKLYNKNRKEIRCEVKLMGKGNSESADAVIARDSDLFVADTLSEQNKAQLDSNNVKWVELKNNTYENIVLKFIQILDELEIEHTSL